MIKGLHEGLIKGLHEGLNKGLHNEKHDYRSSRAFLYLQAFMSKLAFTNFKPSLWLHSWV